MDETQFLNFVGGFQALHTIIGLALDEDKIKYDITTRSFTENTNAKGSFIAKSKGIIAGTYIIKYVYQQAFPYSQICVKYNVKEGGSVKPNDIICEVEGPLWALLSLERTVLNFLTFMSGIATKTQKFVSICNKYGVYVRDTRKTLPGLRMLSKWAVKVGGAIPHRNNLYEAILIKDNHIRAAGGISNMCKKIVEFKKFNPHISIEIEAQSLDDLKELLKINDLIDVVMFDNFSLEEIKKGVNVVNKKFKIEVSGGISLDNIEDIAKCGIDYVSIGKLTHSFEALDISFELNCSH